MTKHTVKGNQKISPVMIELEFDKLNELYRELCNTRNTEVRYSEDQLEMANCVIRQMKDNVDNIAILLWNMLNPHDIDDGSSGL